MAHGGIRSKNVRTKKNLVAKNLIHGENFKTPSVVSESDRNGLTTKRQVYSLITRVKYTFEIKNRLRPFYSCERAPQRRQTVGTSKHV